METPETHHTDKACRKLLQRVFGDPQATLAQLAPEGWRQSLLWLVYHPTLETQYAEYVRAEETRRSWFRNKRPKSKTRLLTFDEYKVENSKFDEYKAEHGKEDKTVDEYQEFLDLFGNCVWNIFSDNHDVVSQDGRAYDLGSFRGSGGFIADFINACFNPPQWFGYLDFYMGFSLVEGRADLIPVYELIFARLKEAGCDWYYAFPRLFIVSPDELREGLGLEEKEDLATYDPGKALADDLEKQERARQVQQTREELEADYREDLKKAKHEPLPKVVQAYKNTFGILPKGYPTP